MTSYFKEIAGIKVHYEKVGDGPQVLLLIPGAVGCTTTDFPDQLDGGLDQKLFTIVVIDLPGYGKSRPPERSYLPGCFRKDAAIAADLMDKLGHKLYSVLGWSDGAKVASLIAINYQARVEKLVIWGIIPTLTEPCIRAAALTREVSAVFNPKSIERYNEAYGHKLFEQIWGSVVDSLVSYSGNATAFWDIRKEMRIIKCPTLILHGDRDPLVDKEQALIAEREIPDSRLVRFSTGSHNIHQVFVDKFNKIVTEFLVLE